MESPRKIRLFQQVPPSADGVNEVDVGGGGGGGGIIKRSAESININFGKGPKLPKFRR